MLINVEQAARVAGIPAGRFAELAAGGELPPPVVDVDPRAEPRWNLNELVKLLSAREQRRTADMARSGLLSEIGEPLSGRRYESPVFSNARHAGLLFLKLAPQLAVETWTDPLGGFRVGIAVGRRTQHVETALRALVPDVDFRLIEK